MGPPKPGASKPAAAASSDAVVVLHPPAGVLDVATRLERAGHETWCVGGAIRDALLGRHHSDWDLATAATPQQVMRLFRRTVPVGVEHGTVGVLDQLGVMHEVTTFRRDVRTDGRHADVLFGASLDDDLARRDFTINAIAYSPFRRMLHDPFGGRDDLAHKVIRAVGAPSDRMREDRLRALRAIRFAARLDFTIDDATWDAIKASAPYLTRLSAERVKDELTKTMDQVERPSRALALWRDSGALSVLVPALAGVDETTIASLDCLPAPRRGGGTAGSARATARADARRLARLAALFIALPADHVRQALRALRFSNADVEWMAALAAGWNAVGSHMERALGGIAPPSAALIREWVAAVGRLRVASLLRIAAGRWAAIRARGGTVDAGVPPAAARVAQVYRRALQAAFHDAVEVSDLAIDGDDLVGAGIAPGPRIGEILRRLLEVVLADPAENTRDRLLALAQQWAASGRARGE